MSQPCTTPTFSGDSRYVLGKTCTWHDRIAQAGNRADGTPCCPNCGGELLEVPTEADWWAITGRQEAATPGVSAMMRWSRGRCYQDQDTLENVYRQAMEGQQ